MTTFSKVELGKELPFETGHFAAAFCVGTMTPGHAPIETLDELIRVTRPGGFIAYSLRHDAGQLPHYLTYPETLEREGKMRECFAAMPSSPCRSGEPSVMNAVHVCEVPG
jgi:SAM-dependent methyltransferase